jgi:hypothetical protein
MGAWQLTSKDLKRYPHFDSQLSVQDAVALATDPKAVVAHKFYPFMLYTNRWTRFAKKGEEGDVKKRPIRYASRGDAYIFAYYRHLLTQEYEAALSKNSLSETVLAYRRLLNLDGTGKCNIHFAYEAFEKIKKLGDCCVVALDISSFFESLDHRLLKSIWCDLLNVEKLPLDHYRIFRTVTRYAVVEKQAVYERLGYYGLKRPYIFGIALRLREIDPKLWARKGFRRAWRRLQELDVLDVCKESSQNIWSARLSNTSPTSLIS